ncbi:MAG: helix-turn-helix domain-containing protein [Candidatus Sericytochromatia bacterium]
MSDVKLLSREEQLTDNSIPGFNSVGQILCYYRKLKGISLEDIERNTRINIKYLYLLEQDINESMPSPVFVYSYIKHFAKEVGLDGNELVKLYQRQFGINDISNPTSDTNSSKIVLEQSDSGIMYLEKEILDLSNNNGNDNHDSLDFDKLYNEMSSDNNESLSDTVASQEINNMQVQEVHNLELLQVQEPVPVMTQEIIDATSQAERIIVNARREADRILREAKQEAGQLRVEAKEYAESILMNLEVELTQALIQVKNGKDFIKSQRKK